MGAFDDSRLERQVPLPRSPDRLVERASQVVARAGVRDAPADTAFGFTVPDAYEQLLQPNVNGQSAAERQAAAALHPLVGRDVLIGALLALFRRWWVAASVVYVIQGAVGLLAAGLPGLAGGLLEAFVLLRFGLLADVVGQALGIPFILFPVTFELSAWYAGPGLMLTGITAVVAAYGFYVSLAGRAVFGRRLLEDV
jgi:hypothetical protein